MRSLPTPYQGLPTNQLLFNVSQGYAKAMGLWPRSTVAKAGGSMWSNINENTLSKHYQGSTIADMFYYLKPLFRNNPDKFIIMVGTNDLVELSINEMVNGVQSLYDWNLTCIPNCKIIVSKIVRRDDL